MHEESLVTHLLGSEEIVVVGAESVIGDGGAEPLTKAQTRLLPFALLDRASAGQSRSARHIVAVAERVLLTAAERETLWDVVSYGAVATFVSDAAADIVLPGTPRRSLSPPPAPRRRTGPSHWTADTRSSSLRPRGEIGLRFRLQTSTKS